MKMPQKLLTAIKEAEDKLKKDYADRFRDEVCEIEYYVLFVENQQADWIGLKLADIVLDFPYGYSMNKEYKGKSIQVEQHLIERFYRNDDPENEDWEHVHINLWNLNK